jgi:hypothetical protein
MRIFLGLDIVEVPDSTLAALSLETSVQASLEAGRLPFEAWNRNAESSTATLLAWLRAQEPAIAHVASEITQWQEEEVHGTEALIEALGRLDDGRDTRALISSPFRLRLLRAFDGEGWIVMGDQKAWGPFYTAEMVRFHFAHRYDWILTEQYEEEANPAQLRILPPSLWRGIEHASARFQGLQHSSTAERNIDACLDFMQSGIFKEKAFELFLELVQVG